MLLVLFIVSFMNGGVKCGVMSLSGGTADEEPLVYRAVDGLGREILVGGERRELRGANAAGGVLNVDVGAGVGIIVSRRPAQVATNEISERKEEEKKNRRHIRRDITSRGLASDELLPSLSTLTDDIHGIPEGNLVST